MSVLKVIIVDDEQDSREVLVRYISDYCPGVEVTGLAGSVADALQLLKTTETDGLLLDIRLPDGMGFDLLAQFPSRDLGVIFVTAYDEFSLKALKLNALDYLLKPVDPQELVTAIGKLRRHKEENTLSQRINSLMESLKSQSSDRIALSTSTGWNFLPLDQIIRLEGSGSYTTFYTADEEKLVVSKNLGEFEKILPEDRFSRSHQSHIIQLDYVRKVFHENGSFFALLSNGERIPVSHGRKEEFLAALHNRSL